MNNYRSYFPIFEKNPTLHYLDSGATTLKPLMMVQKMMEYYTDYSANIHRGLYPISEKATMEYELVREKVAKFIGAKEKDEIVFTSGTTDSLNLVASGWGGVNLVDGDEVVVTEMEHHSNLVPWQELARNNNLKIKYLETSDYRLEMSELIKKINPNTRLLAITHVSNVLGTVNPIKEFVKKVREISPNIVVVVDGAQAVAHLKVDVSELDVDFYAFSGHKMYGPTGVGVLYAKSNRWSEMSPSRYGGGMIREVTMKKSTWASGPDKFEAGTPAIGEVIGLGAAVDFMTSIGIEKIVDHERELTNKLFIELTKLDWVKIMGRGDDGSRLGVVSMYSTNNEMGTSHDIADILGRKHNVATRAGHHCAMPLHSKFEVSTGTVRASLGIYNSEEDIMALITGLNDAWTTFIKK